MQLLPLAGWGQGPRTSPPNGAQWAKCVLVIRPVHARTPAMKEVAVPFTGRTSENIDRILHSAAAPIYDS